MTASQLAAPAFTRFALVFGVGFVLGTVRVLWIAPQLGARAAELAEAPVMLVVIYFAARWIAKRFCRPAVSDGARRHRVDRIRLEANVAEPCVAADGHTGPPLNTTLGVLNVWVAIEFAE